ncbi:MAG: hypothetical protein RMX96_21615 [Nostoc sp. ChiSLP02]|nr:hypothetical protein [Nostoc sp. DedSLP05]MDZ8097236.1 hypothetical protein [Nostoc sp. DedSLP01]MDZ8187432.1 hypothetical protein [Nostoc sp. ChiSLP02]
MRHFSVDKIKNTRSEVLSQATVEPVLLTTESQSSYVVMSVESYEQLINRLAQLEDLVFSASPNCPFKLANGWYRNFYGRTQAFSCAHADLVEVILVGKRNDNEVYKQLKRLLG